MIATVLLFIVSLSAGLFLCTRLYLLAARGQLNVKGAVYSRASTPVLYWVTFACAFAGTILTLGIVVTMAIGLMNDRVSP